jgi:predicted MFS family arabinose efflux permease
MQALFVSLSQLAIGLGALTGGLVVDRLGTSSAMVEGGLAAVLTLAVVMFVKATSASVRQAV